MLGVERVRRLVGDVARRARNLRRKTAMARPRRSSVRAADEAATAAANRGDWASALELWTRLLGDHPGRGTARVHLNIGRAHRRLGQLDEAEERLRVGAGEHPRNPRIARELAEVLTARKRWAEAERQWRRALELEDPPSAATFRGLSHALRQLGRFEDVEDVLSAGMSAHPQDRRVLRESAELASQLGRWEEAADRWRELQQLDLGRPAPRISFVRLSAALRRLGDVAGAVRVIDEGLAHHPGTPMMARERAEIAAASADWGEAARWRERALEWSDGAPPARWCYEHGLDLERAGQLHEAAHAYDGALQRLRSVEDPWANEAEVEWGFRLQYVHAHLDGTLELDRRFRVVVGTHGSPGNEDVGGALGRLGAQVTSQGLRVWGYAHASAATRVQVYLDDLLLRELPVESAVAPPTFGIHLKHSLLQHVPTTCRLSARLVVPQQVESRDLGSLLVHVPDGDGRLAELLAGTSVVTKKGTLADLAEVGHEEARRRLQAYQRVREAVRRELDASLMILYGTLLGYRREGAFIVGDDDIDAGYVIDAVTPQQAKQHALRAARELLLAGFDVKTRFGGSLLKVESEGVEIDIYPIWFFQGRAWAYDAMKVSRGAFEPPVAGTFYGVEVLVPNDSESVLEQTYGPGWRSPDPGFTHRRSQEVLRVLQQTQLTHSEARELARLNARDRETGRSTGTFSIGFER